MVETLWYPRLLSRLNPWHLYDIFKGRLAPVVVFWMVLSIAVTGRSPSGIGEYFVSATSLDGLCAHSLQVTYVVFLGPDKTSGHDLLWLIPSLLWYYATMPGIVVWAMLTMLDGSWGTLMRGSSPIESGPEKGIVAYFTKMSGGVVFVKVWLCVVLVAAIRMFY